MNFPKSKGTRRFLKWFIETSMFNLFIESVIANSNSFCIFDNRILTYNSEDASLILTKMKDWKQV